MKYFNFIFLYAIIFFPVLKQSWTIKRIPFGNTFHRRGMGTSWKCWNDVCCLFYTRNNVSVDDTLESISSNASTDTQIHESYEQENNIKGMRQMNIIPIPANSAIELKPSGMHIMIIRPEFDLIAVIV